MRQKESARVRCARTPSAMIPGDGGAAVRIVDIVASRLEL
jgi:hypothetical protein